MSQGVLNPALEVGPITAHVLEARRASVLSWVTQLIRAGAGVEPLFPLPVRRGQSLSPKSCIFISFHKKEALAPESAELWQHLCWPCFGQRRAATLWKGDSHPVLSPAESVKGGRSLWSDRCGRTGRDGAGNAVKCRRPHIQGTTRPDKPDLHLLLPGQCYRQRFTTGRHASRCPCS